MSISLAKSIASGARIADGEQMVFPAPGKLRSKPSFIEHIRPYQFFSLLDEPPGSRIAQIAIPSHRGEGGITLLETFVVVAACRIVSARRIFEIGTYRGATTLNLALNIPEEAEVLTLDLDADLAATAHQHPSDAELTRQHLAVKEKLDFLTSTVQNKVKILTGNSMDFDFSPWFGSIDLVLIDGGHDFTTVKADTENALRIISTSKPACILWHDYENRDYADLTSYLDQLSNEMPLFHVEDTMLCAWFNESARRLRSGSANAPGWRPYS